MMLRGALACWGLAFAEVLFAAPADDVKALMEQGKPAEAYSEAKKHPDQLGIPAFDFYFGIVAIDAGHAGEGVLALERYLLNFPENVSARLQLARGYYVLNDDARAHDEFEALRKLNPPADVSAAIDKYLDSIRLRESRYLLNAGAYVEFGIGHDSNINAGPAAGTPVLPGSPLTIAGTSKETPADFGTVGIGGYVTYPVRPGISLFAIGQGEQKYNAGDSNQQFDLGLLNLTGGVSVLRDKNTYRAAINYGAMRLGTSTYRTSIGALGEWQYQFDQFQSASLGVQYAQFSYGTTTIFDGLNPGTINVTDNSSRDADFYGVSAGYRRAFAHPWEPVVSLLVSYGDQQTRTSNPALTPRTLGANLGLTFTPVAKWGVQLGYGYLQSDYKGTDFFANPDARHDRYDAVNAAISYLFSRNISFRLEALWSRNDSNASVYEFNRDLYAAKVRYEFK
jgi:hypothetical protein